MLSLQHHLRLWLFSFLSLPFGHLYTCLANYTDLPTTPSEVMEHIVIGLTVYLLLHFISLADGQSHGSKSPTSERRQKKRIEFAHGITIVPYHPDDTPKDTRLDELEYGKLTESNEKPTESNGKTTKSNGKPAESSAGGSTSTEDRKNGGPPENAAIEPKQQNGKPKDVQQDESGRPMSQQREIQKHQNQQSKWEMAKSPVSLAQKARSCRKNLQKNTNHKSNPKRTKRSTHKTRRRKGKDPRVTGNTQENKAKDGKHQQGNIKSGQGSKSSQKKKGKESKLQTGTTTDAEAKDLPRDLPPEIPRPILRKRPRRRFGWFGRWWDPF
ncbi:hypothetical protein NM208_g8233 [Fusarium decemcellulare]|uniref:Uncharacterized protein n=1 Tax=Fusarium decemcellulare TaxID=57161 RepID=A0ACC1S6N2_9HYPO|nr:hypothetical protein NM208_g8233 [Fusarium decemcellulare]